MSSRVSQCEIRPLKRTHCYALLQVKSLRQTRGSEIKFSFTLLPQLDIQAELSHGGTECSYRQMGRHREKKEKLVVVDLIQMSPYRLFVLCFLSNVKQALGGRKGRPRSRGTELLSVLVLHAVDRKHRRKMLINC